MIQDVYLSPVFWLCVLALTIAGALISRSRLLSFGFVAIVFASQYVIHAAVLFGTGEIFWFCALFWCILVAFLRPATVLPQRLRSRIRDSRAARSLVRVKTKSATFEPVWVLAAKLYLIVYGVLRLFTYPWLGGELDLSARLEASQDNRLVFILGLAVLPPIAAVATQWLRRGYRFGAVDFATAGFTAIALFTSGSKATILPAVIVVIGAAYLTRRPLRSRRFFISMGAAAAVLGGIAYGIAVAAVDIGEALGAVMFRLAANTDSLEYLAALEKSPSDFPFAGFGALIPTVAKRLGYDYDFSPGVWLQGTRYDQWQGFGPNPGIVMDYFANLGWLGLTAAVVLALTCWACTRVGGAVGAALGSVTYLGLVDVTLYQGAVLPWIALLGVLFVASWATRFVRWRTGVDRLFHTYHSLPIWLRGGFESRTARHVASD